MRGAVGLVGIVVALGIAYALFSTQLTQSTAVATAPPQQQIDVTAIKASLLAIGQAQRIYVAEHGAYTTLAELRAKGAPHLGSDARDYVFDVRPNGAQGFTVTATPAGSSKPGWPTLTIDETLQVSSR